MHTAIYPSNDEDDGGSTVRVARVSSLAGRLDPASGLADPASRLAVLVSPDGGVSGSLPRGWRDGPVDGLGGPVHGFSIFLFFLHD